MAWVDLVTLLAILEFFWLVYLVGKARARYGVKAPATSGNAEFERYFRVQQNTLETLIMFLPALWIAAHYWDARWMALIGVFFVLGRVIYLFAYVGDPKTRTLGYAISIAPVAILTGLGLYGAMRAAIWG